MLRDHHPVTARRTRPDRRNWAFSLLPAADAADGGPLCRQRWLIPTRLELSLRLPLADAYLRYHLAPPTCFRSGRHCRTATHLDCPNGARSRSVPTSEIRGHV